MKYGAICWAGILRITAWVISKGRHMDIHGFVREDIMAVEGLLLQAAYVVP